MAYDNNETHQETVYEGGHQITRNEARAYASLLNDEVEELKDTLEPEYESIRDDIDQIEQELIGVFESARDDLQKGLDPEAVEGKYDSRLDELGQRAENAFRIDGDTPLDMIQSKVYQKERWLKVVENNDRGSTSNKNHSMFTDTVREDIRRTGEELEEMKASYIPFEEFVNNINYVKQNFPDILSQSGEGRRQVEFTDAELEEHLEDSDY